MTQNPLQMTDNELKLYIDQVFVKYDKERDGTLKTLEMANYLTQLFQILGYGNISITPEQAQQAIKMIDKNNDNKITKMQLFLTFKELANTQVSQFGDVKILFMGQGGFDTDNAPPVGQNSWGAPVQNNIGGNTGGWGVNPNTKPWTNSNTATQNTVTTNNASNPWGVQQPQTNVAGNTWGATNPTNNTNQWTATNNINPNANQWGNPTVNQNNAQTNQWGNANTNPNTNPNNNWKAPTTPTTPTNTWGAPTPSSNNAIANNLGSPNGNNNTWGNPNINTNNQQTNNWAASNQNSWGNPTQNNANSNNWGQPQGYPSGNLPNQVFKGSQQNSWGPEPQQQQQQAQTWGQQARGSGAQQQTFQQQARGSGTQMQPALYVGGQQPANYQNQYMNQNQYTQQQQMSQPSGNLVWGNTNTQPLVWGVPGQRPGTPPSAAYTGNVGMAPLFYDPYGGYRVGSENKE